MKTLFYDIDTAIRGLEFAYSLKASREFLECADQQLTEQFTRHTGLKPSKDLNFSLSTHGIETPIYGNYLKADGSIIGRKLMINLYVNHHWNPVTIYWRSKHGNRDFKLHDTDIKCDEIEFWFEKLDTVLYHQQLYPRSGDLLKLNGLSFELITERLNIDITVHAGLLPGRSDQVQDLSSKIYGFINKFNLDSEKKERANGVVHNSKISLENEALIIDIDLGSAGIPFLKKLLKFMSGLEAFSRVTLQ